MAVLSRLYLLHVIVLNKIIPVAVFYFVLVCESAISIVFNERKFYLN